MSARRCKQIPVQENEDESQGGRRLVMARQRFQTGCLMKRGVRRKVWVGRWREAALDKDGNLVQVQRSEVLGLVADIPTRREARKLLEQRLQAINGGHFQPESTITFADFVDRRWKPAFLPAYKRSTRQQFELALNNHLLPVFGNRRLCDINKSEIQTFFGTLLSRLSADSTHGIHRVLRRIFSTAVEWSYLHNNPATGIKLPPCRRREPPFITSEQFRELLVNLPEPVRTMVLLAMMTSMRVGEVLALRWKRVDLRRGIIRVAETFYRGQFSTVKSRRSERQIPLSPVVLSALKNIQGRRTSGPEDLVFATRKGTALSDGNLLKRFIYPACTHLGIPRLSWHALRHLHGTLLSHLGVPVAVAQAQLGHADPRITLSIYTHVLPGAQRDAVERLERHLFPNVPKLHQNSASGFVVEHG